MDSRSSSSDRNVENDSETIFFHILEARKNVFEYALQDKLIKKKSGFCEKELEKMTRLLEKINAENNAIKEERKRVQERELEEVKRRMEMHQKKVEMEKIERASTSTSSSSTKASNVFVNNFNNIIDMEPTESDEEESTNIYDPMEFKLHSKRIEENQIIPIKKKARKLSLRVEFLEPFMYYKKNDKKYFGKINLVVFIDKTKDLKLINMADGDDHFIVTSSVEHDDKQQVYKMMYDKLLTTFFLKVNPKGVKTQLVSY